MSNAEFAAAVFISLFLFALGVIVGRQTRKGEDVEYLRDFERNSGDRSMAAVVYQLAKEMESR